MHACPILVSWSCSHYYCTLQWYLPLRACCLWENQLEGELPYICFALTGLLLQATSLFMIVLVCWGQAFPSLVIPLSTKVLQPSSEWFISKHEWGSELWSQLWAHLHTTVCRHQTCSAYLRTDSACRIAAHCLHAPATMNKHFWAILFQRSVHHLQDTHELLRARWCKPTLSIVDVRVGDDQENSLDPHYRFGPTRFSVIPRLAVGNIRYWVNRLPSHVRLWSCFLRLQSGRNACALRRCKLGGHFQSGIFHSRNKACQCNQFWNRWAQNAASDNRTMWWSLLHEEIVDAQYLQSGVQLCMNSYVNTRALNCS